ncbi:MAG: CRTAC1 family protein [Gammaproteobacteria bacterium]
MMHDTGVRRRIRSVAAAAVGASWLLWANSLPAATAPGPLVPVFADQARAAGLNFTHFNGMSGELYFPENMGSGVALLDYDHDGDLDVFAVQGNMLGPGKTLKDAIFPPPQGEELTDRLYRNDSTTDAKGHVHLHFTDVTRQAGIHSHGYGMGVAVGDINNDGWPDIYVTNFGHNQLWLNRGDGTFTDVTAKAGVDDARWSVSAAFVDYDRDGYPDLFVANYVDYNFANAKPCRSTTSARDYCSPLVYDPVPDRLFHNRGDGTFEDVTEKSGIAKHFGNGLGVVIADFDSNGWPDIYVANDGMANNLWMNHGDGTFDDDGMLAGAAVNMDGKPEASMGVDAADFDGDGDIDLFMTHLTRETNTLYVNDGSGWFEDQTVDMGLAGPSFDYTGFGTGWKDLNNDGWLDLFSANGAVTLIPAEVRAGDKYPLHQRNQVFLNLGKGRYRDVSAEAGKVFELSEVSRGAAFGDIDNDGDTDIVVSNNSGPLRLLVNTNGNRNHWLGLRLTDPRGCVDCVGARVRLLRPGGRDLVRLAHRDGSYGSSNDPRVLFGLGSEHAPVTVRVHWPDGTREEWDDLSADRYHALRKGNGKPVPAAATSTPSGTHKGS